MFQILKVLNFILVIPSAACRHFTKLDTDLVLAPGSYQVTFHVNLEVINVGYMHSFEDCEVGFPSRQVSYFSNLRHLVLRKVRFGLVSFVVIWLSF